MNEQSNVLEGEVLDPEKEVPAKADIPFPEPDIEANEDESGLVDASVEALISSRQHEWEDLISRMWNCYQHSIKLTRAVSDNQWEICEIVGAVCEDFGVEALKNFRNIMGKLSGDLRSFRFPSIRLMQCVYYKFIHGRDTRFKELTFNHHATVYNKPDAFEWLTDALKNGWSARELHKRVAVSYYSSLSIKSSNRLRAYVTRFMSRFAPHEPLMAILVGEISDYIEKNKPSEELHNALLPLKEWSNRRRMELPEDPEDAMCALGKVGER